jgi:hypothetical protein
LVEAPNPRGMVPTASPYIWKVIDNLHMLWMGIWIHHHAITNTLVNPDLGRSLKSFLVTAWRWMKPLCSGWLRLQIYMEWFLQPLHTYERWLTTFIFICCGWLGFGSIIMPLPIRRLIQIWDEEASNPWSLLGAEWSHCAVVQAWNPHGMIPTASPNIWKVIINLHMLWMGIWIHHHAITSTPVNWDLGRKRSNPWSCLALNEAIVHWLRLQIYMEWFPHLLHTYERWLTTIICCGWGYRPIIMPLPVCWLIKIWEASSNPGQCLVLNEAIVQYLRLKTHKEWFPQPLHTYERW